MYALNNDPDISRRIALVVTQVVGDILEVAGALVTASVET
jgi:hypothetical protein